MTQREKAYAFAMTRYARTGARSACWQVFKQLTPFYKAGGWARTGEVRNGKVVCRFVLGPAK